MKTLAISLSLLSATPNVFAMPVSSAVLISEAMTNNSKVREFIKKHADPTEKSIPGVYSKLSAEVVNKYNKSGNGKSYFERCADQGSMSRSGSVLEIKISGKSYRKGAYRPFQKSLVLATPHSEHELSVCN